MKHLFIVNPTAGKKDSTEAVCAKVEKAFENRDDSYEIFVTSRPMEAPEKIKEEAKKQEHLRVYACGGDGTFNECVCGAAGLKNVAVCPFPTGTGNDFCRMFGEEKDLFRNLKALDVLPYHTMGESKYHELGIEYKLKGLRSLDKADAAKAKQHIIAGIRQVRSNMN